MLPGAGVQVETVHGPVQETPGVVPPAQAFPHVEFVPKPVQVAPGVDPPTHFKVVVQTGWQRSQTPPTQSALIKQPAPALAEPELHRGKSSEQFVSLPGSVQQVGSVPGSQPPPALQVSVPLQNRPSLQSPGSPAGTARLLQNPLQRPWPRPARLHVSPVGQSPLALHRSVVVVEHVPYMHASRVQSSPSSHSMSNEQASSPAFCGQFSQVPVGVGQPAPAVTPPP